MIFYYFIKMFKMLVKTSNNLTLKRFRSTAPSSVDKHWMNNSVCIKDDLFIYLFIYLINYLLT